MSGNNLRQSAEAVQDNLHNQCTSEGEQSKEACAGIQLAQWNNLPVELRERPQWAIAAPDKRPLTVDGCAASPTDRKTWGSFEDISRAASERGLGIGCVIDDDDPYTCIDFDIKGEGDLDKNGSPLPPEDWTPPEMIERFNQWVDMFDSYTEVSISGKGMHIWVKAHVQDSIKTKHGEVYSKARFMICTGDIIRDRPIIERNYLTNEFANHYRSQKAPSAPLVELEAVEGDVELFAKITKDDKSGKFVRLRNGNWQQLGYPSQSEADLALLGTIVHYTQSNEQCRRMFRQTMLGQRDKATRNDVYLNRSLVQARATQQFKRSAIEHGREQAINLAWNYIHKAQQSPLAAAIQNVSGFRLVSEEEMASRPPVEWWIKNVIPKVGIVALYGPPSSGKSFLGFSALGAIANGRDWFGRKTKQAPVVYVALEGKAGVSQRVKAYQSRFGDMNIHFIEDAMDLRLPEHRASIVKTITEAGLGGGVLCIDTLAASAPGMDENTSTDMGAMVAALQEIQEGLGGVVMIVHHTGKDQTRGLRGWSGLTGALDNAIEVVRTEAGREWRVAKSKDGADGEGSPFDLDMVVVGLDEDGAAVTSCVVVSGDTSDKREEYTAAIIVMISEYYERGEFISPATNSPTNAYKILKDDPSFPKGLNAKLLKQILRDSERDGSIEREEYKTPSRNCKERWKVL